MVRESRKRVLELDENESVPAKKTASSSSTSTRKRTALSQIENILDADRESASSPTKRRRISIDTVSAAPEALAKHFPSVAAASQKSNSKLRGLLDLPIEMFDTIFKFLSVTDKLNLASISKKLNQDIYGSSKNLNEIKWKLDLRNLEVSTRITRSYTAIKLVNFNDDIGSGFELMMDHFKKNIVPQISTSVKEIDMVNCHLQGYNYVEILKNFPNLESLMLKMCYVDGTKVGVPKFRLDKLRKIVLTMNNMVDLFQDFLLDNQVLEKILLKGTLYGRRFVNPTIDNIFHKLSSLITRQENLKVLAITDGRFFGSDDFSSPKFQLSKLLLSLSELYPTQQINLNHFICSQRSIQFVCFNIRTTQPTEFFSKTFSKILEMPTLSKLSLGFYSNIGMEQVLVNSSINQSVRSLSINNMQSSSNFIQWLEVAVNRFPNAEVVWLIKENDLLFTDPNFLRPLNKLKNLKELVVKGFDMSQIARIRCPWLKTVNFEFVEDATLDVNLFPFVIAHRDIERIFLRLRPTDEYEIQAIHEFVEFTLQFCQKLKSLEYSGFNDDFRLRFD